VRELNEDVRSLVEHNAFLFQKVRFLLDTTSGFINTEQSDIIKRFSVISSMLAPPMLVTGIYGMNVRGLPMAEGLYGFMVVAILITVCFLTPLFYFRYRGWL
jgi:magnesium transporter